jgi:DNA (cytosine-5)-methyltransferase 1
MKKKNKRYMNELALFAGAGGGILGGNLFNCNTICAVERNAYSAQVLAQRQNDRTLKPFPIWSDIETFDGTLWKGRVDIISGGFPCQDISPARSNNHINGAIKGLEGSASGLWREYKRIIDEVQPSFVFIENSHNLRSRGLDTILKDLNGLGYNAAWGVLGAGDNKAPHQRKRLWIMAADTNGAQWERGWLSSRGFKKNPNFRLGSWWETEPKICRVDDGVANRVDRLIAIGNGQVPSVAERAFTTLASILEHTYEKEKEQSESTSGL